MSQPAQTLRSPYLVVQEQNMDLQEHDKEKANRGSADVRVCLLCET